jgi:hypothetical protein
VEVDPETGMLANEYCPSRIRVIMPSYMSPGFCTKHTEQPVAVEETTIMVDEPDPDSDKVDVDTIEKDLDKVMREMEIPKEEGDDRKPEEKKRFINTSKPVPKMRDN